MKLIKTTLNKILLIGLLTLLPRVGSSQGFVNLDFESANLTGYSTGNVPATNAFPGWEVSAMYVLYDTFSLSGESISIEDINGDFPPIQGQYYAFLASGFYSFNTQTVSLSQTGTIPSGMESINFWGNIGGLQITFAGQPLLFSEIGSTANYNIYAADISAFAGQTGQLLFSLPAHTSNATLDNIQFSSTPVPEPSVLALFAGGLCLMWRGRQLFGKN